MVWPLTLTSDKSDDALKEYQGFRNNEFLCDGTIQCLDGKCLSIHRVVLAAESDVFNSAFKDSDSFKVNEAEGYIIQKVVEWVYGVSSIIENPADLLKLVQISGNLSLSTLEQDCLELFKQSLQVAHLFESWEFAKEQKNMKMEQMCLEFACQNFAVILNSSFNKLLTLSIDTLTAILDSDVLDVATDDCVLKTVKAWVDHDKKEREMLMPQLLSCVRLGQLSPKALNSIGTFYDYSSDRNMSQKMIVASRLVTGNTIFLTDDEAELSATISRPRAANQLVVVQVADGGPGRRTALHAYDCRAKLWYPIYNIQVPQSSVAMAYFILNQKHLIFTAREPFETPRIMAFDLSNFELRELSTLNMTPHTSGSPSLVLHGQRLIACLPNGSMEEYNQDSNCWLETKLVPDEMARRNCLVGASFVSVKGKLYAIGGMSPDLSRVSAVIRSFNDEENVEQRAQMSQARAYPSCCEWNGKIVICGGFSRPFTGSLLSAEIYDPVTNSVSEFPCLDFYTNDVCVVPFGSGLVAIEGHQVANRMIAWSSNTKRIRFFDKLSNKWEPHPPLVLDEGSMILGISVVEADHLGALWSQSSSRRTKSYLEYLALKDELYENDESESERNYRDALVENLA